MALGASVLKLRLGISCLDDVSRDIRYFLTACVWLSNLVCCVNSLYILASRICGGA